MEFKELERCVCNWLMSSAPPRLAKVFTEPILNTNNQHNQVVLLAPATFCDLTLSKLYMTVSMLTWQRSVVTYAKAHQTVHPATTSWIHSKLYSIELATPSAVQEKHLWGMFVALCRAS